MPKFPEREELDIPHPSQDESDRYPKDVLIRERGWRIYSRKDNQEAEWERRGIVLKESKLLEMIRQEKRV